MAKINYTQMIDCYGFNLNNCNNAKAIIINSEYNAIMVDNSSKNKRKTPGTLKKEAPTELEKISNLQKKTTVQLEEILNHKGCSGYIYFVNNSGQVESVEVVAKINDTQMIDCYGFNLDNCNNARAIIINSKYDAIMVENKRKTPDTLKKEAPTELKKISSLQIETTVQFKEILNHEDRSGYIYFVSNSGQVLNVEVDK